MGTILRDDADSKTDGETNSEVARLKERLAELELAFRDFQIEADQKLDAATWRNDELSKALWLKDQEILDLENSRSWRITRPLRLMNQALIPLRQRLTLGRRLRWLRSRVKDPTYHQYANAQREILAAQIEEIQAHIRLMPYRPTFSIVVDARSGVSGLGETVQSVRAQCYPVGLPIVIAADGPALAEVDKTEFSLRPDVRPFGLDGDFLIFLRSGERLAPHAVYEFASLLNQYEDTDLIYGDEDVETSEGNRSDPFYKPAWSPDYLETFNYIGFPACYRRAHVPGDFKFAGLYDFVLRYTERTQRVRHIAKVLGHKSGGAYPTAVGADLVALEQRLIRTNRHGTVRAHPIHVGCHDIEIALRQNPLVSIIIPTAGKTVEFDGRKIDLIANVVAQIRTKSSYKNLEIIVVDNGNLSQSQCDALDAHRCRRVTYEEPVFNVSKKLNLGAAVATGDLFLLLNDDIEVVSPSWIERMVEHFEKPNVGVVGAKLLYPDGTLQHAGVVHIFGNPDHVRRFFPRDDAGYFFSTCGVRNYLAVTGACMMATAKVYRDVGGYNESLAISYNDVDFCLRIVRLGLSVLYAPAVELTHMEAQSRNPKLDWTENMLFLREWGSQVMPDGFYNERFLSLEPPTFAPKINPRLA